MSKKRNLPLVNVDATATFQIVNDKIFTPYVRIECSIKEATTPNPDGIVILNLDKQTIEMLLNKFK